MSYVLIYLVPLLLALLITPAVGRLAHAVGALDRPGVRKVHRTVTPRIGGLVVVVGLAATLAAAPAVSREIAASFGASASEWLVLLGTAVGVFLVGLLDDLRGVPGAVKFVVLTAAAGVLCASGVRFDAIVLPDWFSLELGVLAWPVTILWIVGVTVGINLIDGLDGLAAGISVIACGVIAAFALYRGQQAMGAVMLAMMGALSGFLVFNFNPAKIFLGDCGSLFVGYVIGSSSVLCAAKTGTFVGLALPLLALGIPIFDSLFAVLRRGVLERRSIFSADRGHIHHRLLDLGLCQRHVVIVMYAATLLAVALGLFMIAAHDVGAVVIFAGVLVLVVLLFQVVGSARLAETVSSLQRNRAIARQVRRERRHFEDAQLRLREARGFDGWWRALCAAADEMGLSALTVRSARRGGRPRTLAWRRPGHAADASPSVTVRLPVPDRRIGPPLRAELTLSAADSLEAVGRRASLFGRLIDEHSVARVSSPSARRRPPGPAAARKDAA